MPTLPNIVLVHGAFADGSSWSKIIPLLAADGYNVTAVQNPLSSAAEDVAVTRRVIDAQTGPTVVVGHSYGGHVITQAAHGAANVKALVYVAAMAPDTGDSFLKNAGAFPPTPLLQALMPDAAGSVYIDRAKFHNAFCADVDDETALVLAATQKPIAGSAFGDACAAAAWHDLPSWYAVCTQDNAIHPDLERWYAKRIGATTIELESSHVPFLSHPAEIAQLIKDAAHAA